MTEQQADALMERIMHWSIAIELQKFGGRGWVEYEVELAAAQGQSSYAPADPGRECG